MKQIRQIFLLPSSHSVPHNPSFFFPNGWRSLPIYVALTNAIAISFPILQSAALSPLDFRAPMFAAGLIPHWHTFQHSVWRGAALNRQNIEQHDIVCKGFYNITGYRQPHWWTNPICCKSELFYGAMPTYTRWELLLLLLMYLCYFPPHLVFIDTNRKNHGKETTSSVMSH